MADLADRMQRRDRRGQIETLPPIPGPPLLSRGELKIAAGQVDADGITVDVVKRALGGNVRTADAYRNDKLDFVVEILGLRRVRHANAGVDSSVGRLEKKERRFTIGITSHLASVGRIIASNAENATHGETRVRPFDGD